MQRESSNYASQYQNYLDSKGKSPSRDCNSEPTQTKLASRSRKQKDPKCKLCVLFVRRDDVARILNQGLYNKYTSSIDYYYTKDINALLFKKRKAFCIKYFDDLVYDTPKEYLKKSFSLRESRVHMEDIKNFYTKFRDFPRFFEMPFFQIMGSMIRKHRRLEYYRVFKGKAKEEPSQIQELATKDEFQLIDMLGESFKQNLSNQVQQGRSQRSRQDNPHQANNSFINIQKSFKELKAAKLNKNFIDFEHPFSSDYYQYYTTCENIYPLYSVNDSHSAIQNLVDLVDEIQTDINPKPKLKFNPTGVSTGGRPPLRMPSPKFTQPKSTRAQGTPTSQRTGFASTKMAESAATLALANKIFSNPNLSRQSQRQTAPSDGRSRSEKTSSSPSMRSGSKSNRNSSAEKGEPQFFKDKEIQQKLRSMKTIGYTPAKYANEGVSSNLNMSKRKLLIDVQDININRTNLYKSITDKFKSSKNLNLGGKMQLPGKDFTPYIEASVAVNRSNTMKSAKNSFSGSKKYLMSKRSESATKSGQLEINNSGTAATVNDENYNRNSTRAKAARKSTSQGPADRILQSHHLNSSAKSINTSKQNLVEEHEAKPVLTIKQMNSEPMTHVTGNTPKKFFQSGPANSAQRTTPTRKTMAATPTEKRLGTPQGSKKNLFLDQMLKVETPKTRIETNKPKTAGGGGLIPPSVRSLLDNNRSRSMNPTQSKANLSSPQSKLKLYREALSSRKRNRSAENQG